MILRRLSPAPACLLLLAGLIALPAAAQSQGGLRIQLRIVDCAAAPRRTHPDCPVPHQRSDAPTPVPPQVQALTPVDLDRADRPERATVTY